MNFGNRPILKKYSKEVALPFAFCAALGGIPFCGTALLSAAPLKSATVTEIKNEVKLSKEGAADRAAKKEDTVVGKDRLWTGKKSRAEIEFSDKSIARLGANTQFSFDPASRNMKVDRGTALIHVPPGQDGARISSPAATAAIMGDVVAMRVDGKGVTQIVALSKDAQGPIKVTFNKTGETRTLQAGEMLTIDPMATRLPEPLTVAVDVFVQSSGLASGFEKKLPDSAQKEIKQTEEMQEKEIKSGNLEGEGKVKMKDDARSIGSNTANTQVITQTTGTGRFAGTYRGNEVCVPPGPLHTFAATVTDDGLINLQYSDGASQSGFMNNDGTFTLNTGTHANGSPFHTLGGSGRIDGNSFSGTASEPSETCTLTGSK